LALISHNADGSIACKSTLTEFLASAAKAILSTNTLSTATKIAAVDGNTFGGIDGNNLATLMAGKLQPSTFVRIPGKESAVIPNATYGLLMMLFDGGQNYAIVEILYSSYVIISTSIQEQLQGLYISLTINRGVANVENKRNSEILCRQLSII